MNTFDDPTLGYENITWINHPDQRYMNKIGWPKKVYSVAPCGREDSCGAFKFKGCVGLIARTTEPGVSSCVTEFNAMWE